MAFELSNYDHQLLKFSKLFRQRFMDINVSIPLEEALDLGWKTLAECFRPEQLLMRQALIDKYYPQDVAAAARPAEEGEATATGEQGESGEAAA